jgi:hypothetical protein
MSKRENTAVCEAPTIIGTCTNCIAPGNLLATLAVIVIGIGIAVQYERAQGGLISTPLNSIFNELFVNPMATIVTSPDPTENKAASN